MPHPSVVESWPGLWYSFGRVQLKKLPQKTKIRQASWNVGTLTGCSLDPAETLKRRKAQRAYIQGTKQKGEKAKEIGKEYKILWGLQLKTWSRHSP